jgi:hypothetical protein
MLIQVRADGKTSINSSKLINWIVFDYFEHFFEKRKKKLCKAHINSRKLMLAALKENNPQARMLALMEFARSIAPEKEKTDLVPKDGTKPA